MAVASPQETPSKDVTITELSRTLDLNSQLVKETVSLTLSNGGSSPVKSVHFAVAEDKKDKVAFFGATVRESSYFNCNGKRLFLL